MSVNVIPTLAAMAEVYRLSTEGGTTSPRFRRYVQIMREEGVPAAGYNPMTSKPVLETIERLLAVDAEREAERAATGCVEKLPIDTDVSLFLTVSTPGVWTDRIATEVEHRLAPTNWSGGPPSVLLWTGEDASVDAVRRETVAQVVRLAWIGRHGAPPASAAQAMGQEGIAYALAGVDGEDSAVVSDALDVVGADESLATKTALLYGDETAVAMGFLPLGLPALAGYRHAIACARRAMRDREARELVRSAWTPIEPK